MKAREKTDKEKEEREKAIASYNETFKKNHTDALLKWAKDRPGINPPVVFDETGRYKWLNRKERKRQEKFLKKQREIQMRRK